MNIMKRGSNNPNFLPREVKREVDVFEGTKLFVEKYARVTSDFEAAPKHIKNLREVDKHKQPNLYKYIVDPILDCLKYDIENVHKKSGIRRMIERKFKKGKVQEITNLVDLLDIR